MCVCGCEKECFWLGGGKEKVHLRSLSNAQKKPTGNHAAEILNKSRTGGYNGPDEHPAAHVDAGFDARDEHVGGDLHEDVADEETAFAISVHRLPFFFFSL